MSTFVEENELKAFMSEIELSDVVAVFHKGSENLTQFFQSKVVLTMTALNYPEDVKVVMEKYYLQYATQEVKKPI